MKRKVFFIMIAALTTVGFCLGTISNAEEPQWYRGNVHMHSFWSDGNVFPEMAVDWYKDNGYQFVVLSDHTYLQQNPNQWIDREQAKCVRVWENYRQRYGEDNIETRNQDGKNQVRLKTFVELQKLLDVPGKFIMIPGHEINDSANGVTLHAGALNVTATIPFQRGETLADSIDLLVLKTQANGKENEHISDCVINHHAWPYYDIDPLSLAKAKHVRLFEFLCANGGPAAGYKEDERFWTRESYWDVVTSFRLIEGLPLIYGLGTDDTHDYLTFGDRRDNPGECWIVVRANELEPNAIMESLQKGDFYASNGVEMKDVQFDRTTGTLAVEVKPESGVNYRIDFIGTKKNFDQTVTPFLVEKTDKNPERKGWTFSNEIGVVLDSSNETKASYTVKEDDLYVRAVIVSDKSNKIRAGYEPDVDTAWTQPYCR